MADSSSESEAAARKVGYSPCQKAALLLAEHELNTWNRVSGTSGTARSIIPDSATVLSVNLDVSC